MLINVCLRSNDCADTHTSYAITGRQITQSMSAKCDVVLELYGHGSVNGLPPRSNSASKSSQISSKAHCCISNTADEISTDVSSPKHLHIATSSALGLPHLPFLRSTRMWFGVLVESPGLTAQMTAEWRTCLFNSADPIRKNQYESSCLPVYLREREASSNRQSTQTV